jgi:CDP-diacylglycerol diphosphatase
MAQGEPQGHAILKDIHGVLQYLLIPTARVSGIESPLLLQADAPDYWAAAWQARQWMARLHGSVLPREAVALTVNSQWGRSQNQLHIHVSCVRPELPARLQQAGIGPHGSRWRTASTAMPIWRVQYRVKHWMACSHSVCWPMRWPVPAGRWAATRWR